MSEDKKPKETKKPEEQKEVVVAPTTAISAERLQSKKGVKKLEREDQMIPRLKLMQGLSPEVQEGIAKYGDLVNSLSKENYGKAVRVVPVVWWKSRIYWRDRKEGGGIMCRSFDAVKGTVYGDCEACEYKNWTVEDGQQVPSKCVGIFNVLCCLPDKEIPELVVASFLKTSFKQGKQWVNLMNYKNTDLFNYTYELGTESVSNDLGTFNVLRYKDLNQPSSDEVYRICSGFFEQFSDLSTIKVDEVEEEEPNKPKEKQQEFDF
jgi:hypothetical protein